MKYIRGKIGFAIFDDGQTHQNIARAMHAEPISAGSCTIAVGYRGKPEEQYVSVHCFGGSTSLNLKSDTEDGVYLEQQVNKCL